MMTFAFGYFINSDISERFFDILFYMYLIYNDLYLWHAYCLYIGINH